jgi:hypothetical protein
MTLRAEILPFVDGNNLIAPRPVLPGEMQASDNGPMFTSEYFIMLKRQGDLQEADIQSYRARIGACLTWLPHGAALLNRAPVDHSQDSIDDYLGVMAGCKELGIVQIPRLLLKGLWQGRGWMNNNRPGVKTRESFMLRFPQLIAATVAAAYPDRTLGHRAVRLLAFPLFLYAALAILLAGFTAPRAQADPWRLSWLLIQATSPVSWMVRLASVYWHARLRRAFPDFGPNYMRGPAWLYYKGIHPFKYYWID